MKKLNVTFDIENDLAEFQLRNKLEAMGGKYLKTLPCIDHLKDNKAYKLLKKAERKAKEATHGYVNKNRV